MSGTTTSIRLSVKLKHQLEKASASLHRGKNWIILKALEEYLHKLNYQKIALEARRQSILVSQLDDKEDHWDDDTDTSGWT